MPISLPTRQFITPAFIQVDYLRASVFLDYFCS
jgi:hypothetical protein